MNLCACGRYGSPQTHTCYYVTHEDFRIADQKRRDARDEQERLQGYEFSVWQAWQQAINEDAQREVDAEFPDEVMV